jgi:hypothetical protein
MKQILVSRWTWRTGGAVCGLCFGIISPVIGSILTAIAWFTGPQWHGLLLQRDGTALLLLTIPLLILGAHCLDLMEKQNEAKKPHSN